MDKRTLLAVVLSMAVLMIFQFIYKPAPVKLDNVTDNKTTTVQQETAKNTKTTIETQTVNVQSNNAPTNSFAIKELKVETEKFSIVFNELTGNIHSVKIKNYEKAGISPEFKTSFNDYFRIVDLNTKPIKHKVFKDGNKTVVEFDFEKDSIIVTRQYIIGDSYLIDVKESLANISDSSIKIPLNTEIGPGLGEGFEKSRYLFSGPIAFNGKKLKSKKANKVKENIEIKDAEWIGYTSKYFAFIKVNTEHKNALIKKFKDSAIIQNNSQVLLNPKEKVQKEFKVFVGPKEYDMLKAYGYSLEKSIDFGVFSFLAIPMLKIMNIFYGATKNYGWAIILLTIIIKIITYPLTYKSMASMKKMKDLQPKMTEIKEKFKGDAQKMNAAMMELYKKHGVNPMGGCLPMLIQIPIFFALYKALLVSIELKGAPFIFWITDLSQKDPYYVTPILMGISMFFQQKLTPVSAGGDNIQQKLFMFMPIIFTFMFLNFPAGLVVYWLTNNILSIAQQVLINKKTK